MHFTHLICTDDTVLISPSATAASHVVKGWSATINLLKFVNCQPNKTMEKYPKSGGKNLSSAKYIIRHISIKPSSANFKSPLCSLCEKYAMDCDIIFKVKGSKYVCIKTNKCTIINVLSIKLNGSCIDYVTEY